MSVHGGPADWWTDGTDAGRTHIATKGIVQNDLVLNLDAGVSSSYPGTGTSWNDLSTSVKTATLFQAVYSTDNYGKFVFDGIDDRANVSGYSITNNFSIELWCRPTATHQIDAQSSTSTAGTSGQKYIIGVNLIGAPDSGAGVSVGTNGVSVYEHSGSYMPPLLVYETTLTTITQIVVVYTNKQPSLYINGGFAKTGLTSPRTNVYLIGDLIAYGSYGYYQGDIHAIRYYNKSLSGSEVAQNFNATRSRFGV